jgi:hypothetical protein
MNNKNKILLIIHIVYFIIFLLYSIFTFLFFNSGILALVELYYAVIFLSIYTIFYFILFLLEKKYCLFLFSSIFNSLILILLNKSIYLDYTYMEEEYYAFKEDFLFGIFAKFEFIPTILIIYILISYFIMCIITLVFLIKKIIKLRT